MEIVEELKRHQSRIKQLKFDAEKIVEARSLLLFLGDWLDTHVLVDDKNLVDFIKQNKK